MYQAHKNPSYDTLPDRVIVNSPFRRRVYVSYGIIAYCKTNKRWMMVKRRYSPEFLSFVRGFYYKSQLETIFERLSKEELSMALKIANNEKYFSSMYNNLCTRGDFEHSKKMLKNNRANIMAYINQHTGDEMNNWLFPKGRMAKEEEPLETAKREFTEETGIEHVNLQIINQHPIVCQAESFNGFTYETRYWVAVFRAIPDMGDIPDDKEISNAMWVDEGFAQRHVLMSTCVNDAKRFIFS